MSTSERSADTAVGRGRFHLLIWVLIYGGLLSICLSFFLAQQSGPMALGFMVGGGMALVAGIALAVMRSHLTPS
jgi:hypothetical protein